MAHEIGLHEMMDEGDDAAAAKLSEAAEAVGPREPRPEPGLPLAVAMAALSQMDVSARLRLGGELWRVPDWRAGAAGRGQTMDEYLSWMERTVGPAKAQAAAILIALSDQKREAEALAKEGTELDAERRSRMAAETRVKELERRLEGKDAVIDRMFRAQQSQGGTRGNRGGTGRPS